MQVTLRDVPPAPSGHHYEVWVLRRNGGGQMEAIGSFTPTSQTVKLDLPLPGAGDYAAVDISVEQDGGSPLAQQHEPRNRRIQLNADLSQRHTAPTPKSRSGRDAPAVCTWRALPLGCWPRQPSTRAAK